MGPPVTKRPVGLMWYTIRPESIMWAGMIGRITCSTMSARIWSALTSGLCWVEMTTLSTDTGLPSTYRTDTWLLPSGRR
jgi:hypothetical protein